MKFVTFEFQSKITAAENFYYPTAGIIGPKHKVVLFILWLLVRGAWGKEIPFVSEAVLNSTKMQCMWSWSTEINVPIIAQLRNIFY